MFLLDSSPFLNLLPFPTAGSGSPTVTNGTVSISGTQITFPATSSGSLVGGVYGVEFGIGISAGYVWAETVAGAASSQTITIDIATYGGTTSSVVNARTYYNLDPLDDPSTRVYSAMLVPLVNSAAINDTTPTEGDTLTGSAGIIVGGYPMTLTQLWQQCNSGGSSCSAIGGATATTYLVTSGNVGNTLKYQQTSTNAAGSGSATSAATSVVASAYDPQAQAVIDQWKVTTPSLSVGWQDAINTLVVAAKANGYWTTADRFYVFAADVETNALINWKNPTGTAATNVSATAFAAKQGFTGDGAADYIQSDLLPNAGVNYQQDNCGLAAYIRTYGSGIWIGCSAEGSLAINNSSVATLRIQSTTNTSGITASGTSGLKSAVRTASNAVQAFNGSTSLGTNTTASTARSSTAFTFLRSIRGFGTDQISFGWIGASFNGTVSGAMQTDVAAFLTAVSGL